MRLATPYAQSIEAAVEVLRRGGVVACPTETFVGLLADARDARAVERVCELKGRDVNNPIGVIVPSVDALPAIVTSLSPRAAQLAQQHWPGPLTLVLHAQPSLHAALHKDGKIGVRVPGASPALDLVRAFGAALTATSANRTGQPPARSSSEAHAIFGAQIDALIEGVSPGGLASTVVDATTDALRVLRVGAIQL
jgi:tRNA threonylcarbamoyl adenosine modification protein (Sua5/YciO/YrdC/YwlC family)